MPKLRAKNDRSGIADLGAHHSYKAPRFPAPRTSTENFCKPYANLEISLTHHRNTVKMAGKAVVRRQSAENIKKLKGAKEQVQETKEMMFSHIMSCSTCK